MNALPVVSFTGLVVSLCEKDAPISLTGSPSGGIFSGNGTTGNIFDPAAAGVGNFAILYTYTDSICSGADTQTVTVNAAPIAGFTSVTNLLTADFTDTTSGATAWSWDFGDGSTDTVQNPSHQYGADGTYQVCLTVTNGDGCDNTHCDSVTVLETGRVSLLQTGGMKVFPNPARESLHLELTGLAGKVLEVQIVDATGRTVSPIQEVRPKYGKETFTLPLNGITEGVYFLQVTETAGQNRTGIRFLVWK